MANKTSSVWQCFTEIGTGKVKCDLCLKTFSYKYGSSSNLKKHLNSKHPTINLNQSERFAKSASAAAGSSNPESGISRRVDTECHDSQNISSNDDAGNVIDSQLVHPSRAKQLAQSNLRGYVTRPITASRQKTITDSIMYMIIADFQAFNIIQNRGFLKLLTTMDPAYKLPSRSFFSKTLLSSKHEEVVAKVGDMLKEAEYVALTTDTWTSNSTQSYMAVTAHYVSAEWKPVSVLLGCIHFAERHTAENLRNQLVELAKRWQLERKIVSISSDSAANIVAGVRLTGWAHVPCFAHKLNLVVQDAIKCIQPIITKVKAIVEFFHRSTTATASFAAMQKTMQPSSTPLRLIMDVPTRWNSTLRMLARVVEVQSPLLAVMGILQPEKVLTVSDLEVMREVCSVLEPFEVATAELSAEKNVSVSKVIVMVRGITHGVRMLAKNSKTDDAKSLAEICLKSLADRFVNIESNAIWSTAAYLDPRFKKKAFSQDEALKNCKAVITRQMQSILPGLPSTSSESDKSHMIWGLFDESVKDQRSSTTGISSSIIELRSYGEEPIILRKEDPLAFWKKRQSLYPRLSKMAKKFLMIPATSVPCERVFSKAGELITDRRNRLSPKHVEQLLFLNANIDLSTT